MNHRNPLSPFAHKAQSFVRAFSPRSPALRAALTGTALGLAALAFAAPLMSNGVSSLPEIGIDAGPALVAGTAANSGFSGTCSENLQPVSLKIRHRVSGQVVEAPTVPCAGGVWQVAGLDLSGLNDGPLLLLAKHEDLAGQPTELSASLLKGSPAPRLGIDAPALIHPGNLESYRLSGTCSEEGRTIVLTLNDAQGYRLAPTPLPTCSRQHWSTALSGLAALNDGVITLTVTHGEANTQGEIATLSAQALKNVALPGLSIDPLLFIKAANQAVFPVSGTCSEAQQPVSLSVSDRNKVTAYGVALCSGKGWRLPALDLSALADGELRFVATHARAQPVVRTVMQAGLKDTAATVTSNGNAATLTPSASAPLTGNSTSTKAQSSLLQTQTLSFNRLTNKTLTNLPFSVAATASSGLPVSFSSLTPLVCTATGSQGATVSLLLLGTCTLQADQTGNSQYAAATPVQQSFTVGVSTRDAAYGQPAIAAGGNHTIAIKAGGTVWTWGDNERGQLGDVSTTMHSTPVQVFYPTTTTPLSAIAVGAGASHSVALQSSGGTIVTWGSNDFGQLGNGAAIAGRTDSKVPVALSGTGSTTFTKIAVGANHTLALSGGKVWAWGANGDGQLGNNTQTDSATPIQVLDSAGNVLTGVSEIAAGANHSLALINGEVWIWGRPSTATGHAPQKVGTLNGVTAIAAGGDHSLALKDGGVWAWGSDWAGQLGNGSTTTADQTTPVSVTRLTSGVQSISVGSAFSMALKADGTVWAWGYGATGQLGTAGTNLDAPAQITSLSNVSALAAGDNHAVAMKQIDGTVQAWGYNGRGQLGDGTLTFRQEPVTISATNLPAPSSVIAGAYHLISKGTPSTGPSNDRSWGSNWKGQLAETAVSPALAPLYKPAPTLSLVTTTPIAAGAAHTLAGIQSVGNNQAHQLGRTISVDHPSTSLFPVEADIGMPQSFSSVAAGTRHSLASAGQDLWVWGANEAGQLGNGNYIDASKAQKVTVFNNITAGVSALAAGASHSVALVDSKVYIWGSNLFGQLGEPTATSRRNVPQQITSCTSATKIATGWYHTVALCGTSVYTWGNNSTGQLGRSADASTNIPAAVSFSSSGTIDQIAAGAYHTLIRTSTGEVWAWGSNQYGQLGNSSADNSVVPVKIVSSGATAIAAGAGYSVIVKNTETLVMGDGRDGQLGDSLATNTLAIRPTPAAALFNLTTGPAVSLSPVPSAPVALTQSFTATSSVAGTAYWVLVGNFQRAPSLAEIKAGSGGSYATVAANSGNIPAGGAGLAISPSPSMAAGKAYRLFVCVANSEAAPCSNAASVDFMTEKPGGATTYALNVNIVGSSNAGFVTTNVVGSDGTAMYCATGSTCPTKTYAIGQAVTLQAFPASGATFTSWTGAPGCTTLPTCTVSATSTVTATFTQTDVGGRVQFPQASYTATSGKTTTITINRTGNTDNPASINIACAPTGSSNCTPFPTTLSFVAGQSSASYTFTSSSTGTVTLTLSPGTGSPTIGSTNTITVNLRKSVSLTPILMLLLD